MAEVIYEVVHIVVGILLICAAFYQMKLQSIIVFFLGLSVLLSEVVCCTVGVRFDPKFKEVFLKDENIDYKLSMAFLSPKFLAKLRLIRSMMYARNIVWPAGAKKNWIQESWFHGYDFRKHARFIDFVASYLFVASVILLMVSGVAVAAYLIIMHKTLP